MCLRNSKAVLKYLFSNFLLYLTIFLSIQMVVFSGSSAAGDMTLNQALADMLKGNESVRAAQTEKEQRLFEKDAARSLYWPKATVTGRYTRIDNPIYLDLDPIRDAILKLHPTVPSALVPSFKETVQEDRFWKSQFNVVWPVFTGGRITAANRAADAGIRESNARFDHTTQGLIVDLARSYFAVRLTARVVRVRLEARDALDLHVYHARRLHDEGFISRSEFLHAKVAEAEAERQLKAARRDLEIAQIALANLLASEDTIHPTTPLFVVRDLAPAAEFIARARETHPVLRRFEALDDKARENIRMEKAAYAPQAYLFGQQELHTSDLTILEPEWAVGVGVNFTLFDGFSRPNRVGAAKKVEERTALLRQKAGRDLAALVSSRYQAYRKALEQFDSLQASSELAVENLHARRRAFQEGQATSLDLVDAQLSFSANQMERMKAAYDCDVSLAELLEASGTGDEFPRYLDNAEMDVEK